MNDVTVYRDTDFFKDGNSIYINYHCESSEPHLHVHDFIEISYVVNGRGIHILGGQKYEVSEGDLFIINYHVPHEFRSFDSKEIPPLKVYNCVFKPDFIGTELMDCHDFTDVIHYLSFRSVFSLETDDIDNIKMNGEDHIAVKMIYKKMLEEYGEKKGGYIELLHAYLIELLIHIFRSLKQSVNPDKNVMTRHSKLMEKSIAYLKENFSMSAKLGELASQSFLSPTYFCKLFKDYTGMTVSEYVQKLRIEEACNMLIHTDDKIIVIAQEIGYKDIKHFNEVFKKLTGVTPSIYRKAEKR